MFFFPSHTRAPTWLICLSPPRWLETRRSQRGGEERWNCGRGRGREAATGGAGERHEGSHHQRHHHHHHHRAPRHPHQQARRRQHPRGLALQTVALQKEEEVQDSFVPQEEQEAEGREEGGGQGGNLRGFGVC